MPPSILPGNLIFFATNEGFMLVITQIISGKEVWQRLKRNHLADQAAYERGWEQWEHDLT